MKSFLIFFFTVVFVSASAQSTIDSLSQELEKDISDSLRAEILINLGFEYRNVNAEKSLEICQEAYALAQKTGVGLIRSIRNIGLAYYKIGNYDTAITISKRAIALAKENNHPREEADAYNTLGNIYYFKGDYLRSVDAFAKTLPIYDSLNRAIDKAGNLANMGVILENQGKYADALSNYQKALKTFDEKGHSNGQAMVLFNMAKIYGDQDLHEKALEYYNKAAEIDRKTGDLVGYAVTLSNIAGTQSTMGDTLAAIKKYKQAIEIYKEAEARCRLSGTLSSLGKMYHILNNSDSAQYYINEAIKIGAECDDKASLIQSYRDLGDFHYSRNNLSSALGNYRKSYEIANEIDLKPEIAASASSLYLAYKKSGQFQEALDYFEISTDIEKEIYNDKNTRELTRLEAEYEFEREKNEIRYENELSQFRLKEKIKQQSKLQIYTTIFLIVFLVLSVLIARLYLLKRKNNEELALTNEEIKSQNEEILQQQEYIEEKNKIVEQNNEHLKAINEEKNALIGIVAHDLKTPLNQIRGLVSLIIGDEENKEEYISKIEKAAERSSKMIDRILDVSAIENKDVEVQKESIDLTELLKDVASENEVLANKKHIKLILSLPKKQSFKTDPSLLKEIIDNLVSNAIKYSPENSEVQLKMISNDNMVKIKVIDNGPGISDEDQKMMFNKYQRLSAQPTGGESSSGLGLAIVKRYALELNGTIYCHSEVGKGSVFTLELPG